MPDDSQPASTPEPSAGWLSLTRTAARAVTSLLAPSPRPADPTAADLPRIVSPDILRDQRIPPRQVQTRKWPVLHAGATPRVDLATWTLRLFGAVEEPITWTWDQFRALPSVVVAADMHCVTRWSRLDNAWEGVAVAEVMRHVVAKPEARFVLIHAEQGFTTNLPVCELLAEDCLFAWANDGRPARSRPRMALAAGRPSALCLEVRQVGSSDRIPRRRSTGILGTERLS